MSDDPQNLLLIDFRRFDAKLDQVIDAQRRHGRRLTALENIVGNLAATELSHDANLAMRADRTQERPDRRERRLDLREA